MNKQPINMAKFYITYTKNRKSDTHIPYISEIAMYKPTGDVSEVEDNVVGSVVPELEADTKPTTVSYMAATMYFLIMTETDKGKETATIFVDDTIDGVNELFHMMIEAECMCDVCNEKYFNSYCDHPITTLMKNKTVTLSGITDGGAAEKYVFEVVKY